MPNPKPPEILVASWNLLADAYIKPEHYPRCDPADFLPPHRHPRLLSRLAALDADVIMTQEVEHALFKRIDDRLRPRGYVGRWAHKWAGKPDGSATFVRAPFLLATSLIVDLANAPDGKPSGHVALGSIVLLEGQPITLVNAHLKWDAPDAAARDGLAQARHLLAVLANQPRTILGGDFNAVHGSDVLRAFGKAGFRDPHDPTAATFVGAAGPVKIDYLLHTPDLLARPVPPRPIDATTALPSPTDPSDHLPLLAAFSIAKTAP